MYSHMMVGSNDIDRSKKFYDATFGAIGGNPGIVDDKGRLIYMHNGGVFLVTPPINGQPATVGNGSTFGFACQSAEHVNAWHAAGLPLITVGVNLSALQFRHQDLVQVLQERKNGYVFRTDLRLRPDGASGLTVQIFDL